MKYKAGIDRVIERYKRFWDFQQLDPPLIMIDIPESAVVSGGHDCEFWNNPEALVEKHRRALKMRSFIPDDAIPMLRPPFSHVALASVLDAEPELHNGKLWVRPILKDLKEYNQVFSADNSRWLSRIKGYYKRLLELAENKFAISLYETPAPADLMGALRGFETVLLDFYDFPDIMHDFALQTAKAAVKFHEHIRTIISDQQMYDGCWIGNSWAPVDTIFFCEHSSVNYSPELYEKFIRPANSVMLERYGHALSYIYYTAGSHHTKNYLDLGCPVWVRSCDGDPPPEIVKQYRGKAIVTIYTSSREFRHNYAKYGNVGICYHINCKSLAEAKEFCRRLGL